MPLIAKGRAGAVHEIKLALGLHFVTIRDIKWARKPNGEQIVDEETGEQTIDVEFVTEDKQVVFERFPMVDKLMWILEELRKATKTYVKGVQTDATDLIGKRLWIIVCGEVSFDENGKLERNTDGSISYKKSLLRKYFPDVRGIRPAIFGDPEKNNGIPGGIFLKPDGLDLNEYLLQTEKLPDNF